MKLRIGALHYSLVLALVAALPIIAAPPGTSGFPPSLGNPAQIRVSVSLVVLHATIENRKGIAVSGLNKDDFQVYEDGILQRIESFNHEDIPVTVGLVVDNSGSMKPKRAEVIAAASTFARASNPADQMFVVNFNERVSFGLPDGVPFTDQDEALETALSRTPTTGKTALYDAIAAGLEHLDKGNRDKKALIVISDGGDNASTHTLKEIMTLAVQSNAIIYTIGLFDETDIDSNPKVLKDLAKVTGGDSFLPDTVNEVVPLCDRIARDIRNQYMIAYAPTNGSQDGAYRAIQVKAIAQGGSHLVVRTRKGYYATAKPTQSATATRPPGK